MSEVTEYSVSTRFRLATFAWLNDRELVEALHEALNQTVSEFAKTHGMSRSDLKIDVVRENQP